MHACLKSLQPAPLKILTLELRSGWQRKYLSRPRRSSPRLVACKKKAGARPAFRSFRAMRSIFGDYRAAPAEAIVQAGLDGVLVVAEAPAGDVGRARGEGRIAEVVILVLHLGRP